jgi:hypothetical protein
MINSVSDIYSSGDAIDFVEDNLAHLERIEELLPRLFISVEKNPYAATVDYLLLRIEEISQ